DSPAAPNGSEAMGAGMVGFDPSQMDPQMMMQMAQALQRLPRNQMNKLQSIMQRAMAAEDVSKEAAELERMLPPKFKQMMEQFQPQMAAGLSAMGGATPQTPHEVEELIAEEIGEQTTEDTAGADMSADSAREIV